MRNASSEAEAASEGLWSLPGHRAAEGMSTQRNRNFRADLRWYYDYAKTRKLARRAAADLVDISPTALDRVYTGAYTNPNTGSPLPPPKKMLSRIRKLREAVERDIATEHRGWVWLPTIEEVWQLIDLVVENQTIGFIWGDSHIGKTRALEWYRDDHNHGRTTYVRCTVSSGVQGLCRAFAKALKIPERKSYEDLKTQIKQCLGPDEIVLVDEVHLLKSTYNRRSKVSCFEFLRELHDECKVPMVLCGTSEAKREFDIEVGEHAKMLQQTDRRGIYKLLLPPVIPVQDVRAIAAHFELPFPEPVLDSARHDRWRNYEDKDAGFQLTEDLAHAHGIKRIFLTIEQGRKLALKQGKPFTWAHVVRAHRIIEKFGQQKKT